MRKNLIWIEICVLLLSGIIIYTFSLTNISPQDLLYCVLKKMASPKFYIDNKVIELEAVSNPFRREGLLVSFKVYKYFQPLLKEDAKSLQRYIDTNSIFLSSIEIEDFQNKLLDNDWQYWKEQNLKIEITNGKKFSFPVNASLEKVLFVGLGIKEFMLSSPFLLDWKALFKNMTKIKKKGSLWFLPKIYKITIYRD